MDLSSVETAIDDSFAPIADAVSSAVFFELTLGGVAFPLIAAWLVLGAAVFTTAFKGVQVWGLGQRSRSCAASTAATTTRARSRTSRR